MSEPATTFAEHEDARGIIRGAARFEALLRDGRALAVLAAVAASLKAVLVKLAYASAPVAPITLLALRLLLALPFFLWMAGLLPAARRPLPHLRTSRWLGLILVGASGYYLSSLADFIGLQYISAGLERLVLFTYPALVLLLEALWRRRRPSSSTALALLLSYAGLVIAFAHDLGHSTNPAHVWLGVGWVLLSAFAFALYYLGSGVLLREIDAARLTGLACLAATLCTGLHFLLTRPLNELASLPWSVWGYALAMAVFCTVLPGWLIATAISRIGASGTAAIGTLGPLLTSVFGWWLLDEPFSLLQALGLVLVVGGVYRMGR